MRGYHVLLQHLSKCWHEVFLKRLEICQLFPLTKFSYLTTVLVKFMSICAACTHTQNITAHFLEKSRSAAFSYNLKMGPRSPKLAWKDKAHWSCKVCERAYQNSSQEIHNVKLVCSLKMHQVFSLTIYQGHKNHFVCVLFKYETPILNQ